MECMCKSGTQYVNGSPGWGWFDYKMTANYNDRKFTAFLIPSATALGHVPHDECVTRENKGVSLTKLIFVS